ncbi:two-component sensor histidine kinase [Caldovatus sediminis]|uniref:histidine kinase n=1 Tax=Caldovatus sediminis TaxID=2041189 RepID=A0A8J2ZE51_9PROT|nr:histidine kinase [Caldovatus sediminis]GGG44023.1 two-component sensor histidine kinase [Caldovatus sediminis]
MTETSTDGRASGSVAGGAASPPEAWSSGGPPAGLFHRRADRVIALVRAGVAIVAFLAIRLEPGQPEQLSIHARALMAAYALYAVMLAVALGGFRVVQRPALGTVAHVVDIGVFTVLMFLTAGPASPFFVLFNFSLLAAALRWGWRGALWTAVALTGLFFLVGIVFIGSLASGAFDPNRFMLRLTHLLTIGAMLVFFGAYQQRFSAEVLRLAGGWPTASSDPVPLREALAYGAGVFDAPRALLVRDDPLEPWLHVAEWRAADGTGRRRRGRGPGAGGVARAPGTFREERLSPDEIGPVVSEAVGHSPFVLAEGMAMVHRGGDVLEPLPEVPLSPALRRRLGIDTALCLPVRAEELEAWLVIPGRDSGSAEDFLIGAVATARIAAAFQRAAAQDALLRAAAAEDRLRLGRDLHDGILQSLAGAVLKLQAALRRETPPPGLAASVTEVCELLAAEQRELRAFINRLRPEPGAVTLAEVELAPELERVVLALQVQWGMRVTLTVNPPGATVPERLVWHFRQLVREAAANAARHGKAEHFAVEASHLGETLCLRLADDGTGLPQHGRFDAPTLRARGIGPRSLRERVLALGGSLVLDSSPAGLRLLIDIPLGGAVAAAAPQKERVAA